MQQIKRMFADVSDRTTVARGLVYNVRTKLQRYCLASGRTPFSRELVCIGPPSVISEDIVRLCSVHTCTLIISHKLCRSCAKYCVFRCTVRNCIALRTWPACRRCCTYYKCASERRPSNSSTETVIQYDTAKRRGNVQKDRHRRETGFGSGRLKYHKSKGAGSSSSPAIIGKEHDACTKGGINFCPAAEPCPNSKQSTE